MKKYLLTLDVYYNGLSSIDEPGKLVLEVEMDENRQKKGWQFIELENDYKFDESHHPIPENFTTIYVKSAKVVKKCNIREKDENFVFVIRENHIRLITRGEDVLLRIGYPEPC